MSGRVELLIKGMHCQSCETLIKDELSSVDGITDVEVNSKTGLASLNLTNGHVTDSVILNAVKNAGYEALITKSLLKNHSESTLALPQELEIDADINKNENGGYHIKGILRFLNGSYKGNCGKCRHK